MAISQYCLETNGAEQFSSITKFLQQEQWLFVGGNLVKKAMTSFLEWSYTESAWFGHKDRVIILDSGNSHDRLLKGDWVWDPKQRCVLIKTLERQRWVDTVEGRMIQKKYGRGNGKTMKGTGTSDGLWVGKSESTCQGRQDVAMCWRKPQGWRTWAELQAGWEDIGAWRACLTADFYFSLGQGTLVKKTCT